MNLASLRRCDWLGACASLLASIGGFAFGVDPLIDAARLRSQQSGCLHDLETRADEADRALRAARRQQAQVQEELRAIEIRLTSASTANARLRTLSGLADSCGLKLSRIEPGAMVPGVKYHTVPLRISGAGGFREAAAFLTRLHTEHRDIRVVSFRLASPVESSRTSEFSFGLHWYTALDAADAGAAGTPAPNR